MRVRVIVCVCVSGGRIAAASRDKQRKITPSWESEAAKRNCELMQLNFYSIIFQQLRQNTYMYARQFVLACKSVCVCVACTCPCAPSQRKRACVRVFVNFYMADKPKLTY